MKKIANRTAACLLLLIFMLGGYTVHLAGLVKKGGDWVTFPVNRHTYSNAQLATGSVVDRNGILLCDIQDGGRVFNNDEYIRKAVLHVVGDKEGNIGTGALSYYAKELMGYSLTGGVFSITDKGSRIRLTVDAALNAAALRALGGYKGAVVFYNYKTGEVLCMVSAPSYDPYYPPDQEQLQRNEYEGAYINRCISSSFTPGSIFKTVTLAAAIENIDDLFEMEFFCPGYIDIDGERIRCSGVHEECDIYDAFAFSCNVVFAQIAQILGGETLYKYAKNYGLTEGFEISGIPVTGGGFTAAPEGSYNLSWSGIGQYEDLVNPLAAARLMAAIANAGIAVNPRLIGGINSELGIPVNIRYQFKNSERLMKKSTANRLADMLGYNVEKVYSNYYNMGDVKGIHAKTGTAEMKEDQLPHAWITGFISDETYPVAFAVVVENSGWGAQYAIPVACEVLECIAG